MVKLLLSILATHIAPSSPKLLPVSPKSVRNRCTTEIFPPNARDALATAQVYLCDGRVLPKALDYHLCSLRADAVACDEKTCPYNTIKSHSFPKRAAFTHAHNKHPRLIVANVEVFLKVSARRAAPASPILLPCHKKPLTEIRFQHHSVQRKKTGSPCSAGR